VQAIKQLFWSSRPISWINTAYPFAAAYFAVARSFDAWFFIGTLFFLIPYNLLMYGINDVFDYESDLRNPRKGGIEGAVLNKRWHKLTIWSSILLCLPFLVFMFSTAGAHPATYFWLPLVVFTVIAYSAPKLRFKERPFLDSVTSTSHFVGPMIVGLSAAGANLGDPKLLAVIASFSLWGIASHAFGAVQDVKADREASISSIATAIGAKATSRFAFACYLLSGLAVILAGMPAALAGIAAVPYLVIVAPFMNLSDEDCERANAGWRKFIWLNFFAGSVVSLLLIS